MVMWVSRFISRLFFEAELNATQTGVSIHSGEAMKWLPLKAVIGDLAAAPRFFADVRSLAPASPPLRMTSVGMSLPYD
jgi:hypothetical protein